MINNFILIALRSFAKHKFYISVNILGMGLAIGCALIAFFNYQFDAKFDQHHKNASQVYRVSSIREVDGKEKMYPFVPLPLGDLAIQNISDIDQMVRLSNSQTNIKIDDNLFRSGIAYVDSSFFDVFSFDFESGDPSELSDKSKIFISHDAAIRWFGQADALGKPISQLVNGKEKQYEVAGIFSRQPENSSFAEFPSRFCAFTLYDNYFDEIGKEKAHWKTSNTLFFRINDTNRIETVLGQLQPYVQNNNAVREDFAISKFILNPLIGMARLDANNDGLSSTRPANHIASLIGPSVIAILILLLACFNLTNTAVAIATRRLKEIGIRKVMGSSRARLIFQFLGETLLLSTFSLVAGLLITECLLVGWNRLWDDMPLKSHYLGNPGALLFIFSLIAMTTVLAGGYPAFYVSKFEPVRILKDKLKLGGTNYFTRTLLILQFAVAFIAIGCAVSFYHNSLFQKQFSLGFRHEGVVLALLKDGDEYQAYKNELASHPEIKSISGAKTSIYYSNTSGVVKFESKQMESEIIEVGNDYLETLNINLVEGRDFVRDSETDLKESVIVTRKFADMFGWTDAVGKSIVCNDTTRLSIIGVVENIYTGGLWREMEPLMIRFIHEDGYRLLIASTPGNEADLNRLMQDKWKVVFPNSLYTGRMFSEDMINVTDTSENLVKMFSFLGFAVLLLSVIGLYSVVSFTILKKLKEIGVRKVLGSSVRNILLVITSEFAIVIFISALVGSVGSYFLANLLMGTIWKYYQSTTAITLTLTSLILFVGSGLAIGHKVYLAAMVNPSKILRSE